MGDLKEKDAPFRDSGDAEAELISTKPERRPTDVGSVPGNKLSAVFENPLADVPKEQLIQDVESFCKRFGLMDHVEVFRKGALVAQNPNAAQSMNELSDEERRVLEREHTHKWSQPFPLYWLAGGSSLCLNT